MEDQEGGPSAYLVVLVAGDDLVTWRGAAKTDLGPRETRTPGVIVGKREKKGGREEISGGRREMERARWGNGRGEKERKVGSLSGKEEKGKRRWWTGGHVEIRMCRRIQILRSRRLVSQEREQPGGQHAAGLTPILFFFFKQLRCNDSLSRGDIDDLGLQTLQDLLSFFLIHN